MGQFILVSDLNDTPRNFLEFLPNHETPSDLHTGGALLLCHGHLLGYWCCDVEVPSNLLFPCNLAEKTREFGGSSCK